jgi:hypothetical protein
MQKLKLKRSFILINQYLFSANTPLERKNILIDVKIYIEGSQMDSSK